MHDQACSVHHPEAVAAVNALVFYSVTCVQVTARLGGSCEENCRLIRVCCLLFVVARGATTPRLFR